MWGRLDLWIWELLRALSQVLSVWWRGWRWVWLGDCQPPDSNLTTSAWVGQASIDGHRWARIAERAIDAAFGAGHCRSAAERRE
jgi:hypothetical protein